MIAFRRGVGRRSRKPQIPRLRSADRSGRFKPSTASVTVERAVYNAAPTMIHRNTGSATMPILIGAMIEVIQIAMALMITTNRPSVVNSSRPNRATRTGRANRLTRTRTAAHVAKPMIPAPRSATIGALFGPNGNG